ncbi:hypothetical protein UFOVP1640_41 [uncultured Caudovirales phage]|jgi:hypothetical protein|uniref:Uncharacterized protein n=1 Tax=uncultured Caudovirales phage TaxID=2100421 RepID=A0A6J5RQ33_9CAUD|nr:hypothetical protein UFOVP1286_44 [uncultured Caudovirales phage]CAB4205583.1 hypothetical protein UFOVP1407_74 [uncultured Caudovirales phage]CAB4221640.1 hypothetical protein UFOVP1640_41 [uncultured Caudovirales phage]
MTKTEMVEELVNDLHLLFSERLIDSLRENNDVINQVDSIDEYIEAENEALRIFAKDLTKLYK